MNTNEEEDLGSDCCGAYDIEYEDYGICPECREHCEFVVLGDNL